MCLKVKSKSIVFLDFQLSEESIIEEEEMDTSNFEVTTTPSSVITSISNLPVLHMTENELDQSTTARMISPTTSISTTTSVVSPPVVIPNNCKYYDTNQRCMMSHMI